MDIIYTIWLRNMKRYHPVKEPDYRQYQHAALLPALFRRSA